MMLRSLFGSTQDTNNYYIKMLIITTATMLMTIAFLLLFINTRTALSTVLLLLPAYMLLISLPIVMYPDLLPWFRIDPRTWDMYAIGLKNYNRLFRVKGRNSDHLLTLLKGLAVIFGVTFVIALIYSGNLQKAIKYSGSVVLFYGFPVLLPLAIAISSFIVALVATPAGWYLLFITLKSAIGYPVKISSKKMAEVLLSIATIGSMVFGSIGWVLQNASVLRMAIIGGWVFIVGYALLLSISKYKSRGNSKVRIYRIQIRDMKEWFSVDKNVMGTPGILEIAYNPLLLGYETKFYPIKVRRDKSGRIILPKKCLIYSGEFTHISEPTTGYALLPAFKTGRKYIAIIPAFKNIYLRPEKRTLNVKVGRSMATARIMDRFIEVYTKTEGNTVVKLSMILPKLGVEIPFVILKNTPFIQAELPVDYMLEYLGVEISATFPPSPDTVMQRIPVPKKYGYVFVGVPVLIRMTLETSRDKSVDESPILVKSV